MSPGGERHSDPASDLVEGVAGPVEFQIRDAAPGAADVMEVRAQDDGDEAARARERSEDVWALLCEIGMLDRHRAGVVGPGVERQLAHLLQAEPLRGSLCSVT